MEEADVLCYICEAKTVADVLRRLRESQQLTLQEVAELAGLSKAYVARIEHGEREPERDTLIALLLAGYSLPVKTADRVLLLAGFAPMHHKRLAKSA
jgi:transcriptional regulator with XRE-family HTH domain